MALLIFIIQSEWIKNYIFILIVCNNLLMAGIRSTSRQAHE